MPAMSVKMRVQTQITYHGSSQIMSVVIMSYNEGHSYNSNDQNLKFKNVMVFFQIGNSSKYYFKEKIPR